VIVPPVQPVAVNVTVLFGHTVVGPLNTGEVGAGLVPIVMLFDAGDTPHEVEHVAV
jgi:hypothetical protein